MTKEFIVRGDPGVPRFRHDTQQWWDGDTITETDLLSIYRPDHIEALVEDGALVPVVKPSAGLTKFIVEQRVRANDKAPGDYKGLVGAVVEKTPGKSEYGVQFEGQPEPAFLNSSWLDAE